jgi:hypothetical protein
MDSQTGDAALSTAHPSGVDTERVCGFSALFGGLGEKVEKVIPLLMVDKSDVSPNRLTAW